MGMGLGVLTYDRAWEDIERSLRANAHQFEGWKLQAPAGSIVFAREVVKTSLENMLTYVGEAGGGGILGQIGNGAAVQAFADYVGATYYQDTRDIAADFVAVRSKATQIISGVEALSATYSGETGFVPVDLSALPGLLDQLYALIMD